MLLGENLAAGDGQGDCHDSGSDVPQFEVVHRFDNSFHEIVGNSTRPLKKVKFRTSSHPCFSAMALPRLPKPSR